MINKLKALLGIDKSLLAIDFGEESIKFVEVKQEKGEKLLTNLVVVPLLVEKGQYKTLLENTFLIHGFSAAKVYLLIGGRNFFFREVNFPLMESQALADTVKWEVSHYIPYEENTYYYDFSILTENKQYLQVMLAAGKKGYIDDLLTLFSDLSVNITIIDGEPFALSRLISDERNYIIVVTGKMISRVFLYQNSFPVLSRSISHCSTDTVADEPLLQNAGLFVDEESRSFVSEIHKAIEYYKFQNHEAKFDKVFFCGEAENLPAFVAQIEKCLEEPVALIEPLQKIAVAPYFDKDYLGKLSQQAAAAIGLVLREENRGRH